MNSFNEISPQKIIDEFCSLYQKLDSHLKFPRSGSIKNFEGYNFVLHGKIGMKLSRYVRNATALEKYLAFINSLDAFFVAVEYFQGNIELKRKTGTELPDKFIQEFFINTIVDSLRSSIDIFSMFVAWFYDINGKENMGFSYEKFIKPLKLMNNNLSTRLNDFYKSDEYKLIKELRDSNKHIGKGQNKIDIVNTIKKYKLHFEPSKPIDILKFKKTSCKYLKKLKEITTFTVDEFCKTDLGYDSNNDLIILFLDEQGTIRRI